METRTRLTVAHTDIDEYHHMGYDYYLHYSRRGLEHLQRAYGISSEELIPQGLGFLVSGVSHIHYRKELMPGEIIIVRSRFLPYEKGIRLHIPQVFMSEDQEVASLQLECFFASLNGEKKKPVLPPRSFLDRLSSAILT